MASRGETCGAQFNQPCGPWVTWITESHAELLAALKAAMDYIDADLDNPDIYTSEKREAWIRLYGCNARDVIAKAEGQT